MTDETADAIARRRMAMIEDMTEYASTLCRGCTQHWLELVAASPGIVIALYVAFYEAVQAAEVPDAMKAATHRVIQSQVDKLLVLVLNAVRSPDPRLAMLHQAVTVAEAMAMGPSVSDEVH